MLLMWPRSIFSIKKYFSYQLLTKIVLQRRVIILQYIIIIIIVCQSNKRVVGFEWVMQTSMYKLYFLCKYGICLLNNDNRACAL